MVEDNQCFYKTERELQSFLSELEALEGEEMFSPFPDVVCDV